MLFDTFLLLLLLLLLQTYNIRSVFEVSSSSKSLNKIYILSIVYCDKRVPCESIDILISLFPRSCICHYHFGQNRDRWCTHILYSVQSYGICCVYTLSIIVHWFGCRAFISVCHCSSSSYFNDNSCFFFLSCSQFSMSNQ